MAFSEASHDRNPLHLSDDYARRTPYGERVVFGILGVLTCLEHLPDRPGHRLRRIEADFHSPLFLGVDYHVQLVDAAVDRTVITLYDGQQPALVVAATFEPSAASPPCVVAAPTAARGQPADLHLADCEVGRIEEGMYIPSWERFATAFAVQALGAKGVHQLETAALVWASYLIGMELPGQRALFSRLDLEFVAAAPPDEPSLRYSVGVTEIDPRFESIRIGGELFLGNAVFATVDLRAFVRRDSPVWISTNAKGGRRSGPRLDGKTALVVGASRGLGAAISHALVARGCTVLANYARSHLEAEQLRASLPADAGEIVLVPGDWTDGDWCESLRQRISNEYHRLDFLICNAAPVPRPLRLHPDTVPRLVEYVSKSLVLVSTPLTLLLDQLSDTGGYATIISSIYVETTPPEWPQYVSAKYAIEGLIRVAAVQYPKVSFLVARPPKLLTDMTNTPFGREGALLPITVADALVTRLCGAPVPGQVEIIRGFR